MSKSTEALIIDHIKVVTDGIISVAKPDNYYSSWLNTGKGLDLIKTDKTKFYLGLNLWLKITEEELLGINNPDDLNKLKEHYSWIYSLYEIRKMIKNIK